MKEERLKRTLITEGIGKGNETKLNRLMINISQLNVQQARGIYMIMMYYCSKNDALKFPD